MIHRALVYDGEADFLTGTSEVIGRALAGDQPVLVALPTSHLERLQDHLADTGSVGSTGAANSSGAHLGTVQWADMSREGRNPGRILPGVLTAFEQSHPGRAVTMIDEPIWAGRSADEYAAALAHEALINLAFAGRAVTVVCPYDAGSLARQALDDARRTHPEVGGQQGYRRSEHYTDPATVAAESTSQLAPAPPHASSMRVDGVGELQAARHLVTRQGRLAQLSDEQCRRFTLAVHEACANALIHSGGPGDLRLWPVAGGLVADVRSPAPLADPLSGRRAAPPTATRGRGLILINEICDLVQLVSDESGMTVRMRICAAQ